VSLTFAGPVNFATGKKISLTAANGITLKPGAALGIPATQTADGYIIANSSEALVTLTPATNTTLTFNTSRVLVQDAVATNAHGITIGGNATLAAGAAYTVASAANKVGTLTIDTGAELTLAGGETPAKLNLTGASSTNGAKLVGTGKVIAGSTEIAGTWQAFDGSATATVTISANSITASAVTAILTGGASGTITVARGGTLLVAANTAINLAANGSIVLKSKGEADGAVGGAINLSTTTAKISGLLAGSDNQTFSPSNIANATYAVGSATGQIAGTASSGNDGVLAGGNATGPNPITASHATIDVTISKATLIGTNA
jgi:hypothetical protein